MIVLDVNSNTEVLPVIQQEDLYYNKTDFQTSRGQLQHDISINGALSGR
jgi:hypothetical protein